MRHPLVPLLVAGAGAAFAAAAGPAQAGCSTGCTSCCLPTSHQVTVPGVTVVPPTVYIQPPSVNYGVGGSGAVGVDVSVNAQASGSAYAQGVGTSSSYAAGVANAQAANLLAASGGGGGYFVDQGPSTSIGAVNLYAPAPPSAPVCVAHQAVVRAVAVQAVCLDDKAVPHPASQLSPERDVPLGFEGELFRCVAGSHMQYVVADWAGHAAFDHGQTVVCDKNEALWRSLDGRLQCRPQKPARDCNERSLLRRFGAGIKVVQAAAAEVCTQYAGQSAAAEASTAQVAVDFAGDGGVGR